MCILLYFYYAVEVPQDHARRIGGWAKRAFGAYSLYTS